MKIEWSLQALSDLDEIQAYLHSKSPRGAERIWRRIHDRVTLQAVTPFAAPLHGVGSARRMWVTRTPYIVLYVVDGDVLKVEAVFHVSRDR